LTVGFSHRQKPTLRKVLTVATWLNLFWVYPTKGFILAPSGVNTVGNEGQKRFRELLVAARKDADLTQAELSSRLKRPQSFVSKYERGERRLDVVEFGEVARALGVDPVQFLANLYREIS
jgi:hypothetical protein